MRRLGPGTSIAALVVVLAALAFTALFVGPVHGVLADVLRGDVTAVRTRLDDLGAWAAVVLVALVLVHVLVPVPAEILSAAAGFVFGPVIGVALMLAAWLASALLAYWAAVVVGRPVAARLLGRKRLDRFEGAVRRGGVRVLLLMRIIPLLPYNGVCAACAIARVPIRRYAWTTVVGILPLTTLAAVLGSRLQEPSLSDPVLWAVLAGSVALFVVGPALTRRAGLGAPRVTPQPRVEA